MSFILTPFYFTHETTASPPRPSAVWYCNFYQRLFALSSTTDRGKVFPSVVWRHSSDVDNLHVFLPDIASGGISLLARSHVSSLYPNSGQSTFSGALGRAGGCEHLGVRVAFSAHARRELEADWPGQSYVAPCSSINDQHRPPISGTGDNRTSPPEVAGTYPTCCLPVPAI